MLCKHYEVVLILYPLQTAWGTRDGADDDDAYRMIRVSRKHHEAGGLVFNEMSHLEDEKFVHGYRAGDRN